MLGWPYKLRRTWYTMGAPVLGVCSLLSRARFDVHVGLDAALQERHLYVKLVGRPRTLNFCHQWCPDTSDAINSCI